MEARARTRYTRPAGRRVAGPRPLGSRDPTWPAKYELLGVSVSATDYDEALEAVVRAARERRPAAVDHMPVHGLIEASRNPGLREKIQEFEIVAPDGQPVRWALNLVWKTGLRERVYGPEFMLRVCDRVAREGIGVYLLGGRPSVRALLESNLRRRFPALRVAGGHSPPFRALSDAEFREIATYIARSGAGIVFVGLGCPKQELVAHRLRREGVPAVFVCVGAAFDFHAGSKRMAPPWMQRRGLEWLYRLLAEPRRLSRRYLVTNSLFLLKIWGMVDGRRLPRGR